MTPLSNMGQQLFEPPDVNGWELGAGLDLDLVDAGAHEFRVDAWPATSGSTSRATRSPTAQTPERVLEYMLARFRTMGFTAAQTTAMTDYLRSTAWTGTDAQLQQRVPGLDAPDRRIGRISVQLGNRHRRRQTP